MKRLLIDESYDLAPSETKSMASSIGGEMVLGSGGKRLR